MIKKNYPKKEKNEGKEKCDGLAVQAHVVRVSWFFRRPFSLAIGFKKNPRYFVNWLGITTQFDKPITVVGFDACDFAPKLRYLFLNLRLFYSSEIKASYV
jgi:hypothetical protein